MKEIKKVHGPYLRKDGRKHVVIIYIDGSRRTVSYPKWLLEEKIGRKLHPDLETIDHIDRNINNNDLSNLRIIERSKHAYEDSRRIKLIEFECVWCGNKFKANPKVRLRSKELNKAGPFCSRFCSGQYGSYIQGGRVSKIKNKVNCKISYVRIKKKNPET